MSEIPSQNDLFEGQMIEKPKRASFILGPDGQPLYTCPVLRECRERG